jgi:hypothetical protein
MSTKFEALKSRATRFQILALDQEYYLNLDNVKAFTHYLVELINGSVLIDHTITIRDRKLPLNHPGFKNKRFQMSSLEEAFNGYWWNKEGYKENANKLKKVQEIVRNAMKVNSASVTLEALREVLAWGAGGTGQRLYTANLAWAIRQKNLLNKSLSMACTVMSSKSPDLRVFKPTKTASYARMNAGFTKYYALACDDVIIYDGRVGAALGLLAKEFCKRQGIKNLPEELSFRWGAQNGKKPLNRNPSDVYYRFPKLPAEGAVWAEWNMKANWILTTALKYTKADWCNGSDGLRKIEAALFVIGYSIVPSD